MELLSTTSAIKKERKSQVIKIEFPTLPSRSKSNLEIYELPRSKSNLEIHGEEFVKQDFDVNNDDNSDILKDSNFSTSNKSIFFSWALKTFLRYIMII